jgi:hypothetical protein
VKDTFEIERLPNGNFCFEELHDVIWPEVAERITAALTPPVMFEPGQLVQDTTNNAIGVVLGVFPDVDQYEISFQGHLLPSRYAIPVDILKVYEEPTSEEFRVGDIIHHVSYDYGVVREPKGLMIVCQFKGQEMTLPKYDIRKIR